MKAVADRVDDFLARIFLELDQDDQQAINAAEEESRTRLEEGAVVASNRLHAAGSHDLRDWIAEPENDARADAAGILFFAYVNGFWRKTDIERPDSIQKFLENIEKLVDPLLARYGPSAHPQLGELRRACRTNVQLCINVSASLRTPPTESRKNSGVKPQEILQFFLPWRKRLRRDASLNATYARFRAYGPEAELLEALLGDARVWAKAEVKQGNSGLRDVVELKEHVIKKTWDQFLSTSRYRTDLRLGYQKFGAALWDEGWPSVEDCTVEVLASESRVAEASGFRAAKPRATQSGIRPRRTPDIDSSRERLALVEVLARELAIVKQELKAYCDVQILKRKYPKFTLWTHIEDSQIKALVDGAEFTPKAYAENLTLTKFGLTSRETLKKDRRKLRHATEASQK
jgi:hypothetical protein